MTCSQISADSPNWLPRCIIFCKLSKSQIVSELTSYKTRCPKFSRLKTEVCKTLKKLGFNSKTRTHDNHLTIANSKELLGWREEELQGIPSSLQYKMTKVKLISLGINTARDNVFCAGFNFDVNEDKNNAFVKLGSYDNVQT